jgi:hypothetical protein
MFFTFSFYDFVSVTCVVHFVTLSGSFYPEKKNRSLVGITELWQIWANLGAVI